MATARNQPHPRNGPRALLPAELLEEAARRFRALGVPSRLRILSCLMNGPRTIGELVEDTGLEQSNLSRQVRELELAGCVARKKIGRSVQVDIVDPTLKELCDLVCFSLKRRLADHQAILRTL